MTVSDRLKILVDHEGSQAAFCRKANISTGALNRVLKQGTGLRSQTLTDIASAYPKLDVRWLLSGEGEMWVTKESPTTISGLNLTEDPEATYERLNDLQEKRIRELEREIKRSDPDLAKELGIN